MLTKKIPATICGIILAAGAGKRMKSSLPKVLHPFAGKTLLEQVLDRLKATGLERLCVVLSPQLAPFATFIAKHPEINICIQKTANGTGGALGASAPNFLHCSSPTFAADAVLHQGHTMECTHVLVCYGDTPLLDPTILSAFMAHCLSQDADLGVLGVHMPQPQGYGRLLLGQQQELLAIREERDASSLEKEITLCNTGIYFAKQKVLFESLKELNTQNTQQEYYLTDSVAVLKRNPQHKLVVFESSQWRSFMGVNTQEELQQIQ